MLLKEPPVSYRAIQRDICTGIALEFLKLWEFSLWNPLTPGASLVCECDSKCFHTSLKQPVHISDNRL